MQYKVNSSYNIYGYSLLSRPGFINIENRGSISMDVTWNECTYEIPKTQVDYKIVCYVRETI